MTELCEAVRAEDLSTVDELLQAGADPNGKDAHGYPPLTVAAGHGDPVIVARLLAAGADPLLLDTHMGASSLHRAAQGGVVEIAGLLIEHGAFVDQQAPTHGHTPLIDASWHKRVTMVRFLLGSGANPDIQAHGGYDAATLLDDGDVHPDIHSAITEERELRADRNRSALRLASLEGDVDGVRSALRSGANVDERAVDGHTPLLDAAREGHVEVVADLLAAGADPLIVDHLMKATPGHKAAYMGHAEVVRLLAENGVDLDAQGPYNCYSALHDAAWHGHADAARMLIGAGARTDLRGLDGRTAGDMAVEYGYDEIASILAASEAAMRSGLSQSSAT